jgi:hypothetical protein
MNRICTRCLGEKELSEFSRTKRTVDGYQDWCKDCTKEYKHAYYLRNKEKEQAKRRVNYQQHKDDYIRRAKASQEQNKEQRRVYMRQYMKENIEKYRDRIRAWARDYQKRPHVHAKIIAYQRMHKNARRVMEGRKATAKEFAELVRLFDNHCAYCNKPTAKPTVDHIIPVVKGGKGHILNLLPACDSCNKHKSARMDFITEEQAHRILAVLGVEI